VTWQPRPIDTTAVELAAPLTELVERLAENVHDTWAAGRIAEGWTLGPQRSEARKEHPCLVPYAELPEIEKDYDRRTATETLKVIVAMGYTILEPKGDRPSGRTG